MSVDPQVDCFLDTNILVYAYDRSAGQKHTLAVQLMESCWEYENGCLSLQVLQEFFVTVTRKIMKPLDHQTARQIVADLAHWRLHAPKSSDLLQAIDLQQSYQLAFWDALVVQSASCLGCKQLLSEDLNHGQMYGEVRVVNPFKEDN
ncbi:MAG: twitching motility protein PilT [Chloroflexi bacterium RBG_19FT_COMBO_50_10]|nr:MAG: twitching motility protein PilT [Chloroflexi bacterium RBG_19FT_COMBO_50_10]